MSYAKFLVDNTTCSRRFHITYDEGSVKLPQVEVKCPYCDVTIFAAKDHPKVTLARQENLVQTAHLSEILTQACNFSDPFEKIKTKKSLDTPASAAEQR